MSNEESRRESHPTKSEDIQRPIETEGSSRGLKRKRIAILASVVIAAGLIISAILVWSASRNAQPQQAKAATDKPSQPPTVITPYVVSQTVNKELRLPGELHAYQNVAIYPKVQGFVEAVNVDRGSVVKRRQPLLR